MLGLLDLEDVEAPEDVVRVGVRALMELRGPRVAAIGMNQPSSTTPPVLYSPKVAPVMLEISR